ncbi:hypothetical protein [Orientia tsutsugamushi]|uniref:hypothetical protein n=1 Tax=Orientia tsutsugamushi TaxID=784 RepID=UPI001574E45C|nr:hypothetical protein [Orientia tsutsugamushi]
MPLFIYFFLYSFHIGILCTYFLRSCYTMNLNILSFSFSFRYGAINNITITST